MSALYHTDKIDYTPITIDATTGNITQGTTETDLDCRVEIYNDLIKNTEGKEERANYLIMIDRSDILLGALIEVKSVIGQAVVKKSYSVKKTFYAGGFLFGQIEIYV